MKIFNIHAEMASKVTLNRIRCVAFGPVASADVFVEKEISGAIALGAIVKFSTIVWIVT